MKSVLHCPPNLNVHTLKLKLKGLISTPIFNQYVISDSVIYIFTSLKYLGKTT